MGPVAGARAGLALVAGPPRLAIRRRRREYLDELGAQLESFIASNPVEFGACWACTMDVGIRAANWLAALVLIAEDADAVTAGWFDPAIASLLLHGRFIRGHLEWAEV